MESYQPKDAKELKELAAAWVGKQDLQIVMAPEVSVYENGQEFRFDFLALRPYQRYTLWGFECKMSRQDFLQDRKWSHYLNHTNLFYFVCKDESIIDVKELPRQVGLLYCTRTPAGTPMLRAKRKASYVNLANETQQLLNTTMMILRNKIQVIAYYDRAYGMHQP